MPIIGQEELDIRRDIVAFQFYWQKGGVVVEDVIVEVNGRLEDSSTKGVLLWPHFFSVRTWDSKISRWSNPDIIPWVPSPTQPPALATLGQQAPGLQADNEDPATGSQHKDPPGLSNNQVLEKKSGERIGKIHFQIPHPLSLTHV